MTNGVRCGIAFIASVAACAAIANAAATRPARVLRVCADPNNLPFSNERGEGFENRIIELVAGDLQARVEYTWWAQRRGFVRETVTAGTCDVVPGVPSRFGRMPVTRPYYRSSYVFVSRRDRHLRVRSFDDPALGHLRLGVQLVGDDGANTPPAYELARRRLFTNIVGFPLYGDYARPNPPARIVDAVAAGEIDVAVVWGPLAGYFAKHQRTPLVLTPVADLRSPQLPMAYDISMGIARRAEPLRREVDGVLSRRRIDVLRILDEYGVPRAARSSHAN
jgi:mxaJ protein